MKLFKFKFLITLLGIGFSAGLISSYFNFEILFLNQQKIFLYIEKGIPLEKNPPRRLLEFYSKKETQIFYFESISELRAQLINDELPSSLILSSWPVAQQLERESLIQPWSGQILDHLYTEMKLGSAFLPIFWNIDVIWSSQNLERSASKPQICAFPKSQKTWTGSLPRYQDWYPQFATFQSSGQNAQIELWGISMNIKNTSSRNQFQKLTLKLLESDLFSDYSKNMLYGLTLKKYESESQTPRLRRASFLREIPLSQLKMKNSN